MPFTVKDSDRPSYRDANHWTEVFEGLIRPAVDQADLICTREDQDVGSRLIVPSILQRIEASDLIVCDLSSHNANVFLELGWALRGDKPYVLIKDDLTDYTFDLGQQYTFEYSHALQPTVLRTEISELQTVLRQTLQDHSRRYSMVARIGLEASAINEVEKGDVMTRLLVEIQERLRRIERPAADLKDRRFPWPILLRRATRLMQDIREKLKEPLEEAELPAVLDQFSTKQETKGRPEIQFSVLDATGVLIYHDWSSMIGYNVTDFGRGLFADVLNYPVGAIAWQDRGSNQRGAFSLVRRRRNLALFSTVEQRDLKIIVETHEEQSNEEVLPL